MKTKRFFAWMTISVVAGITFCCLAERVAIENHVSFSRGLLMVVASACAVAWVCGALGWAIKTLVAPK